MSNEIAVQPKAQIAVGSRGVRLTTIEEAYRFACAVVKSKLAPKEYQTAEAVLIAVQYGAELGLAPMQSLQSIAVINGRPAVWGDGLVAVVRGSGECEYIREWIEGEGDSRKAVCETKRRGEPTPVQRSFSVADAKKAGLWQTQARVKRNRRDGSGTYEVDNDSPWWRYPDRMLGMRAKAWCLRDVYADFLRGISVREEVEDFSPMPVPVPVVESKPVRRLSDLGAPPESEPVADVTPEPSGERGTIPFVMLLAAAEAITDGNSPEADKLRDEINVEWSQGNITADEAQRLGSVLAGAVPFG